MRKILCCALVFVTLLSGCRSKPVQTPEVSPVEAGMTAESAAGLTCLKMGTPQNFNDQRIIALQKLVQLQILRIKALPMTEESTQELAELESLRRRISYPLLKSSSRPQAVTQVLAREAKAFSVFLDARRKNDPQAQSLFEEVNDRYLPLIENQDHWNCLERKSDFLEDMGTEKTE